MIQSRLNNQKTNFIKLLAAFCFVALLFSCQSKTEKRLIGLWAFELDSCVVLNRNWSTEICSNTMTIKQEQECELPPLCAQLQKSNGTWQLITGEKGSDTILFNVSDNPLRGRYAITFYKDYHAMKFKMKLQNDSTLLICSKSILSFTSNQKDLLDKQ